ncbi:hypothetical protein NMY22_g10141 [Coprinellus aureogranulatus]|nr:hypothetical protein NMY22_g10141 [Coprinellus aureogranulatus]
MSSPIEDASPLAKALESREGSDRPDPFTALLPFVSALLDIGQKYRNRDPSLEDLCRKMFLKFTIDVSSRQLQEDNLRRSLRALACLDLETSSNLAQEIDLPDVVEFPVSLAHFPQTFEFPQSISEALAQEAAGMTFRTTPASSPPTVSWLSHSRHANPGTPALQRDIQSPAANGTSIPEALPSVSHEGAHAQQEVIPDSQEEPELVEQHVIAAQEISSKKRLREEHPPVFHNKRTPEADEIAEGESDEGNPRRTKRFREETEVEQRVLRSRTSGVVPAGRQSRLTRSSAAHRSTPRSLKNASSTERIVSKAINTPQAKRIITLEPYEPVDGVTDTSPSTRQRHANSKQASSPGSRAYVSHNPTTTRTYATRSKDPHQTEDVDPNKAVGNTADTGSHESGVPSTQSRKGKAREAFHEHSPSTAIAHAAATTGMRYTPQIDDVPASVDAPHQDVQDPKGHSDSRNPCVSCTLSPDACISALHDTRCWPCVQANSTCSWDTTASISELILSDVVSRAGVDPAQVADDIVIEQLVALMERHYTMVSTAHRTARSMARQLRDNQLQWCSMMSLLIQVIKTRKGGPYSPQTSSDNVPSSSKPRG